MVQALLCPGQDSGDVLKTRQGTRQLWAEYDVIRIILLDPPGPWHGFEWQKERWGDLWEASVTVRSTYTVVEGMEKEAGASTA